MAWHPQRRSATGHDEQLSHHDRIRSAEANPEALTADPGLTGEGWHRDEVTRQLDS
jgi:hypothetical protein